MCPTAKRKQAWERLVELLPESSYNDISQEVSLEAVPELAEAITNGQVTGRTLIRL